MGDTFGSSTTMSETSTVTETLVEAGPTTTSTPGGAIPTNVPIPSTSWSPRESVGFNVVDLLQQPSIRECYAGIPQPLGAYTMTLDQPYTLGGLPNRTTSFVSSFDLHGVWYYFGPFSQRPSLTAYFNGGQIDSVWSPVLSGACARIRFSIHNVSTDTTLGTGSNDTFFVTDPIRQFPLNSIFLVTSATASLTPIQEGPITALPSSSLTTEPFGTVGDSTSSPTAVSSSSSSNTNVIIPAVVVPVVVLLIAAVALLFFWRQRRRARMAPSAAFRADHPEAVAIVERNGGVVGLGGTGSAPTTATGSPHFPLDEKRPFTPSGRDVLSDRVYA